MSNKYAPIAPLLETDVYKWGHVHFYPEGTSYVFSNYTNRGSRDPKVTEVVHFGLQAFIQAWIEDAWKPFFEADEDLVADLYEEAVAAVLGPNNVGSEHIRKLHKLGYLPLSFRSLPEGTLVPLRVPSFTIENTHPDFFWLTNYIETALSASVWHGSTSATTSHELRKFADEWALKTAGSTDGVQFQFHDFSFRGQTSIASAAASSAGHLLSFNGSDTAHALTFVEEYYPGDNGLVLASVPATEHSVATAFGPDDEQEYFERVLDLNPTGIVSVVSDSYDLWNALTVTLPAIHDKIMSRDGKLVIRPDSGDPVDILTGTNSGPNSWAPADMDYVPSPAEKGVVELLWDEFGGTVNEQGYKVLDPHIGVIYGDGITPDRALRIFQRLEAKGFASINVVFGVGSYLFQLTTRDQYSSAIKATWVMIDDEEKAIFKDPVTDSGMKKSAKGRLVVVHGVDGDLELVDNLTLEEEVQYNGADLLQTVWEDGKFLKRQSFADVREVLATQDLYPEPVEEPEEVLFDE